MYTKKHHLVKAGIGPVKRADVHKEALVVIILYQIRMEIGKFSPDDFRKVLVRYLVNHCYGPSKWKGVCVSIRQKERWET